MYLVRLRFWWFEALTVLSCFTGDSEMIHITDSTWISYIPVINNKLTKLYEGGVHVLPQL